MTKGVFPIKRAYWLALDTIQAGVSEIPYRSRRKYSPREPWDMTCGAYQIEDLARSNKVVQTVHDLLYRGVPVPLRRGELFPVPSARERVVLTQ